jgi:hypothetical protein
MNEDEMFQVAFEGTIQLCQSEIDEAEGSIEQAVQNLIGGAGASIERADRL